MKIESVDLAKDAGELRLTVEAYAPTLGWTNVSLTPFMYIVAPPDGIYEYTLRGTPPNGPSLDAIERFTFTAGLGDTAGVRGVRIADESGSTLSRLLVPVRERPPIGADITAVGAAGLRGDKLLLSVRYGGGCARHDFQLEWDGAMLESMPPQVVLRLTHNANGDNCRALLSERLEFDLSVLFPQPQDYVIRVTTDQTDIIAHRPRR